MTSAVKLIVGLGNPGPEYAKTRHNAGAWFVETLAERFSIALRPESKFHGLFAKAVIDQQSCLVLIPTTYMNESGRSVQACAQFYKVSPEDILVAHDELDFQPGTVRLKSNGGHGGHNGLRDIIDKLGAPTFQRIRIGIGHPGDKSRVLSYVLKPPSLADKQKIDQSIDEGLQVVPELLRGDLQKAFRALHSTL